MSAERKHRPIHTLIRKINWPRLPFDMEKLRGVTTAQNQAMQEISLGIFTDMVNAGHSLQETCQAIYLSGLIHGHDIQMEICNCKPQNTVEANARAELEPQGVMP